MIKYKLVNPYIHGEMENIITAKNSIEAGRNFYTSLSEHFNNAVPKFFFTIQKGISGKGKYYHFKVKEMRKDEDVTFTLEPYNNLSNIDIFTSKLNTFKNNIEQKGGKKHKKHKKHKKTKDKKDKKDKNNKDNEDNKDNNKDSDSDSESESESESDSDSSSSSSLSSSDDYKRITKYIPVVSQPINYWWYYPYIYNIESYYIPTFYSYITPIIHITY